MPSRTPAEQEAGQNLYDFWTRAWQEHDAALALQQIRNGTQWLSPAHIPPINGLYRRHSNSAVEAALERALLSADTESEPEISISRAHPCLGLNVRRATECLGSKPPLTNALTLAEGGKRRHNDVLTYTSAGEASRGNKGVPPPGAAQRTVVAAGHKAARATAPTTADRSSRVTKASVRGPMFAMSLRRSNGQKSARIQSLLEG